MGMFKWLVIAFLAFILLMLYGYEDWKAGETVISEKIDEWLDPLFKVYDKFVKYREAYDEVKEVVGGEDNETQST